LYLPDLPSFPTRRSSDLLAKRLIGILRLVLAVEPADGGTDANVLPKKTARFIDQLGQGSDEVLAVDVGTNPLRVSVLDADDFALDRKSTRLNSSHVKISY